MLSAIYKIHRCKYINQFNIYLYIEKHVTWKTLTLLHRAQLYETNRTRTEQNGIKTNKRRRYYEPVVEP